MLHCALYVSFHDDLRRDRVALHKHHAAATAWTCGCTECFIKSWETWEKQDTENNQYFSSEFSSAVS